MSDTDRYRDIIGLPHHRSDQFPHMPLAQRAAQFSPFAALRGYEDEIEETKRSTEARRDPDETDAEELNGKLLSLKARLNERPRIKVVYFQADERKEGGAYITFEGDLKKIDEYAERLIMSDGITISFGDIVKIEDI